MAERFTFVNEREMYDWDSGGTWYLIPARHLSRWDNGERDAHGLHKKIPRWARAVDPTEVTFSDPTRGHAHA